jgi:hypothetical protein
MLPFLRALRQPLEQPRLRRRGPGRGREGAAAGRRLLGARPEEIVFTSGGTEANNTVDPRGGAPPPGGAATRGPPSSTRPSSSRARPRGGGLPGHAGPGGRLGTRRPGRRRPGPHRRRPRLVMHANNEVGTIQDLAEIARLAHEQGILVHTDAAQSIGKVPVDVAELGVDFLTLAGHKLYAPKGVGALFVRSGVELAPLPPRRRPRGGPARRHRERPRDRRPRGGVRGGSAAARDDARRLEALRDRLFEAPRGRARTCAGTAVGSGASRTRSASASRHRRERPPRRGRREGRRLGRRGVPRRRGRGVDRPRGDGSADGYAMGTVRFSVGRGTTPGDGRRGGARRRWPCAGCVPTCRPGGGAPEPEAAPARPADPLHPRHGLRLQAPPQDLEPSCGRCRG